MKLHCSVIEVVLDGKFQHRVTISFEDNDNQKRQATWHNDNAKSALRAIQLWLQEIETDSLLPETNKYRVEL